MRRFRHNPSEAESLAHDLAAGQITPAFVERRLRQAADELDDAIHFKYEQSRIESLRARVEGLKSALSGAAAAPEGPSVRRERLEQKAFGLATTVERLSKQAAKTERQIEVMGRELEESIRMRDPASEIQAQRQGIAVQQAELVGIATDLDVARRALDAMVDTARKELAGQPVAAAASPENPYADALRKAKIRAASLRLELNDKATLRDFELTKTVRRELREAEEDVERLLERSKIASNPRMKAPWRRRRPSSYIDGVRSDLAAGKMSMRDVVRRAERFRRILEETERTDSGATKRITALAGHVEDLENLIRGKERR